MTCSWQSTRNDGDLSPRYCDATPAGDHDNSTDEPAAKKHKSHHVEHRTDNAIGNNKINDGTREELKKKVTCGKYITFILHVHGCSYIFVMNAVKN